MSTAWQVVVLATATGTTVLAVLMLGILRRVTAALEVSTARSPSLDLPTMFDAPASALGEVHRLPNMDPLPDNHFVVTFLEHGCDACRDLAADVTRSSRRRKAPRLDLIFVLDSDQPPFDSLAEAYACVLDADHRTSDEWKVLGTPRSFLVEPTGFVVATNTPNTFRDLTQFADTSKAQALTNHAGHDHAKHNHAEHDHERQSGPPL